MINKVVENLNGEYKIVNVYDCEIHPCTDCRYCWMNKGCCIDDEMQDVYGSIIARNELVSLKIFSEEEVEMICSAIHNHNDKRSS